MALIDGIISYYKSDTNGSYPDAHGSNDGTINGATYNASGKINGAYSFDGVNDKITVADDITLRPSGTGITISAWVKPASFSSTDQRSQNVVRMPYDASGYHLYLYHNKLGGNVNLDTGWKGGPSTNVNLALDVWQHIVMTWSSSSGEVKLYVDGVLEDSIAAVGNNLSIPSGILWMGSDAWTTQYNDWLDGDLDEVAIWSRALTDGGVADGQTATGEVAELYNSGNGLQYPFTPAGWSHKINGISPAKINGIAIADIAKVNGIC